ncbi:MAG TPA: nucleotidyltransferase family protein [Mycobacterium sp.]|nr:nucleotidyltransferase family protein [Mycobacterium sp.]
MAGVTPDGIDLAPLDQQVAYLWDALGRNIVVQALLDVAASMNLPDWYLGASAVSQTVWNLQHGYPAAEGIKDYDVAYFEPSDLSEGSAKQVGQEVAARMTDFGIEVDVHNEARVHLWYEKGFGRHIEQYRSTGHAISTWPTTASAVGVRRDAGGSVVLAPFGLSDLLGMVARPNKVIVSREVYEEKVARWSARWPLLRVIPWDD